MGYTHEVVSIFRPVAEDGKVMGAVLGVVISRASGLAASLSAGRSPDEAGKLIVWESYEDQYALPSLLHIVLLPK